MTVASTFSFTSQHCETGMKSPRAGLAVTFEIGADPKSGKTKAVSVDLI
jgi:cold shock CspA family protein